MHFGASRDGDVIVNEGRCASFAEAEIKLLKKVAEFYEGIAGVRFRRFLGPSFNFDWMEIDFADFKQRYVSGYAYTLEKQGWINLFPVLDLDVCGESTVMGKNSRAPAHLRIIKS